MLAKCWFCWDEEIPSDLEKIKRYIAKKRACESVCWIQMVVHTAGQRCSVLFSKSPVTPSTEHTTFTSNPTSHILHPAKVEDFAFFFTAPHSPHQTSPLSWVSLSSHLNVVHHFSFLLGQLAPPPSLPLCFYFSVTPLCLSLCPQSPFALSAVNGSIMSLLSIKWWEVGMNAAV